MYLSKLVLDPRHPRARRDLGNPYEMHATLASLFDDLRTARPLWRLDQHRPPIVLLQSLVPPDFGRLEGRLGYQGYLREPPQSKPYLLPQRLEPGQVLRFRLEANPTVTRAGKRYGLRRVEDQLGWLERQAKKAGFQVLGATVSRIQRLRCLKRDSAAPIVLLAVRYDGHLRVEDADRLRRAIANGIGHGKALGLGLLSVAPGG